MQEVLDIITSNRVITLLMVIIAIILLIAITKQVFKLLFLVVILTGIYVGFLFYTGQPIPTTIDGIIDHAKNQTVMIEKQKNKIKLPSIKFESTAKIKSE